MCVHETKICPRCQATFECKVGTVMQCQCFGIEMPAEKRANIEEQFGDCLCRKCLVELKQSLRGLKV
ncbi:MAG: cysteine-rich CWC family protein [Chitinophagaceae bacterium]|nr:cysteine-rich CWC family protein [Chitinophagaceae bacterium]